jgi:dTDP-4-amino-4,6-dideoxygalactose transaminase
MFNARRKQVPEGKVPFIDLVTPHMEMEAELMDAIRGVLRSARFIGGPVVEAFEQEFAKYCNVDHCIGVSSGTDALRFALIAAGVEPGHGVVTVAHTFAATAEAILQAKATPYFVDVNSDTFNLSVDGLREFLETQCDRSEKTGLPLHRSTRQPLKAIVPVHLYGQMCDMDPILAIAEEYGMVVIEDACQAHGAEYFSAAAGSWKKAGSMGKAAAFSFYPGKNLGAGGEAGAVTSNDEAVAELVCMLRDHGQSKKYHHLIEGYNGRLDAMQAAILRSKLRYLDKWNAERRWAANTYNRLFQSLHEITVPFEPAERSRAVYHLYVIRVDQRDELQYHLTSCGIATGLHYPIPLHLQPAYARLGYREGDLPKSEGAARGSLSLPMFPEMCEVQQKEVVSAARAFYTSSRKSAAIAG